MEFFVRDILRYLTLRLPKRILRRKYSEECLADLVKVDLRPRHEPATVELDLIPTYDLWLQIINTSPFMVELDRAQIDFTCAGISLKTFYLQRKKFKPGQISEILVTGDIPEGKADAIVQHHKRNRSSISINMDFNCLLHSFSKQCHNLEGVMPRFMNHDTRGNNT